MVGGAADRRRFAEIEFIQRQLAHLSQSHAHGIEPCRGCLQFGEPGREGVYALLIIEPEPVHLSLLPVYFQLQPGYFLPQFTRDSVCATAKQEHQAAKANDCREQQTPSRYRQTGFPFRAARAGIQR